MDETRTYNTDPTNKEFISAGIGVVEHALDPKSVESPTRVFQNKLPRDCECDSVAVGV